jgi:hypothetical protein
MTDKEAMKLALEKIATVNAMDYEYQAWAREALAKQEQRSDSEHLGEPVEWGVDWGKDGNSVSIIKRLADGNIEVVAWEYAPHPQQRTWVGLTDDDLSDVYNSTDWNITEDWGYERAIEAKLKEKNT